LEQERVISMGTKSREGSIPKASTLGYYEMLRWSRSV